VTGTTALLLLRSAHRRLFGFDLLMDEDRLFDLLQVVIYGGIAVRVVVVISSS